MRRLPITLISLAFIILLTSCGDQSGGAAGGDGSSDSPTVLEGVWRFCEERSDSGSESASYSFSGSSYILVERLHSDRECAVDVDTNRTESGSFSIGRTLSILGGSLDVRELDLFIDGGGQWFDIFYFLNDSTLHLGLETAENDRLTSAGRPDEINFSVPYVKQ